MCTFLLVWLVLAYFLVWLVLAYFVSSRQGRFGCLLVLLAMAILIAGGA